MQLSLQAPIDGRKVAKAKQSMQTKKKILRAAAIEFRNNGLSGARVAAIAKRIGMNVQVLYHHFGNKEKLYIAVLEDIFLTRWDNELSAALERLPPDEALIHLWRKTFEAFGSDRTQLAILSDVNTHKGVHMREIPEIYGYSRHLVDETRKIISRGEKSGVFHKGLDASFIYTLITGARAIFVNHNYTLSDTLEKDLRNAEAREEWDRLLFEFVMRGIRKT